ncbi:MAG TPA: thiamine pyrophosphate-dependent enzyme [Myxococcales bacterium]|jgi:pyruvate/2-oxoacid:ferredoxin oxidoreductase beta subunit
MATALKESVEQVRREDAFREGHRLCPGCLEASALHAIGRATDDGRKTVFALGTHCSEAGALRYPDVVAWGRGPEEPDSLARTVGVIQAGAESAISVAEGIRDAADALAELGAWSAPAPNVVAVTSDAGGLAGGLDGLLHTLHRGHPLTIFVLLHEVYGASRFPVPATVTGPGREPIDHLRLAVASGAGLVAQVSPAFPELFAQISREALDCAASAVVFVPAPCLSGWRVDERRGGEVARLACETGIAPGFRWRAGSSAEVLAVPPKPQRPRVEEYLARQQRFEHLARLDGDRAVVVPGGEAEVAALQKWADGRVERLGNVAG